MGASLPTAVKTERCRSCGAAILWARTEKGRLNPIDAQQDHGGNLVLFRTSHGWRVAFFKADNPNHQGLPRHVSHFATCPDAYGWRKSEEPK